MQRLRVVAEPADRGDLGAERAQPGRQHRSERVPDEPVPGQPFGEQLIAQDEDFDPGPGHGGDRVVPGRRGKPEHCRGHQGAAGQQLVAAAAFLAARADVLAVADVPGRVEAALVVGAAVLAADDGGGVRGDPRAGRDPYGLAVAQRLGLRVPGEHPVLAYGPGAGARDRPAVHRRGVERGQVAEGDERCDQDEAEGGVEGHGDGGPAGA